MSKRIDSAGYHVQVETTPQNISLHRQNLGTSYSRLVRIGDDGTSDLLQLTLLVPKDKQSGYTGTTKYQLGKGEQLHQSPLFLDGSSAAQNHSEQSQGDSHSATLEITTMVPPAQSFVSVRTSEVAQLTKRYDKTRVQARATQESKVENIHLANIWRGRLREQQWSDESIDLMLRNWASSTLSSYSKWAREFIVYCLYSGYKPENAPSHVVAEFM